MTTEEKIKAFIAIVGLAGFLFGVYEFIQVRAIEARKPYLERKLAWCEEAVETTARIANAETPARDDIDRFWQMYWGVMGLIEKKSVTDAMVSFGRKLPNLEALAKSGESASGQGASLRKNSLDLAHACRVELSLEWSPIWSRSD